MLALFTGRINPANILYHPETSRVQLINFEMVTKLVSDQMYSDGSEVSLKTMAYIAPEQTGKMNRPLDYRSDLYSLGATLYKLFTGKLIFEDKDLLEFIHSHIAVYTHVSSSGESSGSTDPVEYHHEIAGQRSRGSLSMRRRY